MRVEGGEIKQARATPDHHNTGRQVAASPCSREVDAVGAGQTGDKEKENRGRWERRIQDLIGRENLWERGP